MIKNSSDQLSRLFAPKSIAIVGAAREEAKLGNIIVANIVAGGYKGKVFPINPKAKKIRGLKCYADYKSLPQIPELAVSALPAELTLSLIPEIAEFGTKQLLVFAAGFKEIGAEGLVRENKLISLAKHYGLKIVGPNCLGFINNASNLNATFGQAAHTMGNDRFISQSGAIATGMFDWAHLTGVGFSDFVTLGNKTILSETEVLEYWLKRDDRYLREKILKTPNISHYQPIGLYLESITSGRKFIEIASQLSEKNPIFVLKPGKSAAAQAASVSHTGALANDDAVLEIALKKAGVIRAPGVENFFDLARSFAWENAPGGPNIAVVSNAGGPAVITTDAIALAGLKLAPMSAKTKEILERALPRAANTHNPIDVLGDALADRYEVALDAVLSDRNVNALIVILTPQVMTQIEKTAEVIGRMSAKYKKPILCSFMGGSLIAEGEIVLNRFKIPSFHYPERAVMVFGAMWRWRSWQEERLKHKKHRIIAMPSGTEGRLRAFIAHAREKELSVLPAEDAQRFAALAEINIVPSTLVNQVKEADRFAIRFGYPVVLKISSAKLLHKTEDGGVITDIENKSDLFEGLNSLTQRIKKLSDPNARIQIEKQVVNGLEVIAGFKRDPSFGPVLLVGAGGILTELVADRNLGLPPLNHLQIEALVDNSKVGKLLNGWRGRPAYNKKSLIQMLLTLQQIALNFEAVEEMEINPIIVTKDSAYAVDTKVILKL